MTSNGLYEELIIAGFGGQGIILIGKLLAQTAMRNHLEVTYMPSYGAEVRGGAASCTVIVSDEPVAAPALTETDALITMNETSFEVFVPRVRPGGLVVMNTSMISLPVPRDDVEALPVPADEIALNIGHPRGANMVVLGAYLAKRNLLDVEKISACLPDVLSRRHHDTLDANRKALRAGADFANSYAPA